MNEQLITGALARWEVIWWSRKGRRFIVKEFDTDLHSALELYTRVKQLGAPFATLRCCNVGFPPPEKYRPYIGKFKKKERVSRKGRMRTVTKIVEREVTPMMEVNLKGIWWCPYCREFRKFKLQDGAMYNGYFVPGEGMYCPVCEINHINHHVRKWNPQAQRLAFKLGKKVRAPRGNSRRRTRRRRS